MKKKIIYFILVVIVGLAVWQYQLIAYGISQGYGQVRVILGARPVEKVMADPSIPDSVKAQLKLIAEIKAFAFDSLGLNYSKNYTTFYDQRGQPILWMVTACEPFELKAKEWEFPFLGTFSYKGFFVLHKAKKEEENLKKEGYDTSIDEVAGCSTLGWFKDPILSEMLDREPGSLANIIIHELTHGTLYVKDNVEFNENLASFVGDKGALQFLEVKYGKDSKEYEEYTGSNNRHHLYSKFVLKSAMRLDSLYKTFKKDDAYNFKLNKKQKLMEEIKVELQSFLDGLRKKRSRHKLGEINNTYFMDYERYNGEQDVFEKEFVTSFHSDFKTYLSYLKKKYPSL